jgi:hypothetical protein
MAIGRREKKFLSHDKDLRHVNLIRIAGASPEAYDIYDLTRLKPLIFVGWRLVFPASCNICKGDLFN